MTLRVRQPNRKDTVRTSPLVWLVLLVVLLNSQIFSATSSNPIGIKGIQEIFYALLIVWATFSVSQQKCLNLQDRRLDVFLYLLVPILAFYGATIAWVTFGQPLLFGLLEERRLLALWVYFPITTAVRRGWVDLHKIENMAVGVSFVCCLLMISVRTDILPIINNVKQSEIALREERYGIGQGFVSIAILILFSRSRYIYSHFYFAGIIFLGSVLVAIVQTRQLIVGTAVGLLFLLRSIRAAAFAGSLIIITGLILLIFPSLATIAENLMLLTQHTFMEDNLDSSWRSIAIGIVYDSLLRGEIMGHGSLSPLWNNGFARIYGPFFFLADIGLSGTFYRYGLVGLLSYFVYLLVQISVLQRIKGSPSKSLYVAIFVMLLITAPLGAPLEYRGYVSGFLLAMTSQLKRSKGKNQLHNSSP